MGAIRTPTSSFKRAPMIFEFIVVVSVFYILITGRLVKKNSHAALCSALFAVWHLFTLKIVVHSFPYLIGTEIVLPVYFAIIFITAMIYYRILIILENSMLLWLASWFIIGVFMLIVPGIAFRLAV